MYTLNEYSVDPFFINNLKKDFDNEKIFDICFGFEIMKLQKKINYSMLTLKELIMCIQEETLININNIIKILYKIEKDIISERICHYMIGSLVDIISCKGKTFSIYHEDMYYPVINYCKNNEREHDALIDYIYSYSYTFQDKIILKSINSLYLQEPIFNCKIIDFDTNKLLAYASEGRFFR